MATGSEWEAMIGQLGLKGAVRQLAQCCAIGEHEGNNIRLDLHSSSEYLLTEKQKQALTKALQKGLGENMRVTFQVVDDDIDTVSSREADASARKLRAAQESIKNDPNVHQLMEMFDATVEADSVKPINQQGKA